MNRGHMEIYLGLNKNYSAHKLNYSAHNFYEVLSIFCSLGLPRLAMNLSSKFRTTNGGSDGHV